MTADREARWGGAAQTMREVRHVHGDHDPRAWHWFARGPLVAADGGERDAGPERDVEQEQLRDVSHEAEHDQGANQVWDRGDQDEEDA